MRIHRIHRLTGGTQKGKSKGKDKADKRSKKSAVLFSAEEEQVLVQFLRYNEILYNKRLMDYKDRPKRGTGISFVRRTIWIEMPAEGDSRASTHSLERSLT